MKKLLMVARLFVVLSVFVSGMDVKTCTIDVYGDDDAGQVDVAAHHKATEFGENIRQASTGLWALKYWATGEIITGKELVSDKTLATCTLGIVALACSCYGSYFFGASA